MMKQYFLLAYRYILSHKFHFSLIATALASGFTSFLLLSGYFVYESSYDSFHPNLQHLYRINFELYKDRQLNVINATSCAPVGPTLYKHLDPVKAFARLYQRSDGVHVKSPEQDKWFPENAMYHADSGIFELFQIRLREGNSLSALQRPFTAIVSQSTAIKLFGNTNPVGEKLFISEEEVYEIEGVFEDFPQNSHLDFTILLSFSTLELLPWSKEGIHQDWAWYSFYNYVLLEGDYSLDELNQQIAVITSGYTKAVDERINGALRYTLYPVSKIYLHSDLLGEMDKKGSRIAVQAVILVALLMLLMSLVNYFNLMTSWKMERSRETAIMVVLGTHKRNIFFQSCIEISSHLIVIGTFSLVLALLLWTPFNKLIGYSIPREALFTIPYILSYYGIIVLASVLLSLYYTATIDRSPEKLLGKDAKAGKGIFLRKSIAAFQFFCAICMIIGALIMNKQIRFMEERPTGFQTDNLLFMKLRRVSGDEQFYRNLKTIQQNLEKFSWVTQVTTSSLVPGQAVGWTSGGKLLNQKTTVKIHNYGIDETFASAYEIQLAAGEHFSNNEHISSRSVMINEEAMKALGFTNAPDILHQVYLHGGSENQRYEIIGVFKDFHQRGLHYKIEPIIFHYLPNNPVYSGPAYITLKLTDTNSSPSRLKDIERVIQAVYPGRMLENDLLEDFYYSQYQTEKKVLHTLGIFSILALVICSLGIIGLVSSAALQRAKEIGVRKVLGASVMQIQVLIGKEFFYLMMLSVLFSIPACHYLLGEWLSSFEYKTDLTWQPYFVGSTAAVIFSLGIIGGFIWRYATINPVDSLRNDR